MYRYQSTVRQFFGGGRSFVLLVLTWHSSLYVVYCIVSVFVELTLCFCVSVYSISGANRVVRFAPYSNSRKCPTFLTFFVIFFVLGQENLIDRRFVMPQNGGGKGWKTDPDTGEKVMPDNWKKYLDWLLSEDREPSTTKAWAAENGVNDRTVRRWKADPRFIREWDRRAAELNVHPERTQSVVDALHAAAVAGDVKAASLYLQYIEKFTPQRRVVVDDDRMVAGLSDSELHAELESLMEGLDG